MNILNKPEIIILDFGGQYVFNFKRIFYELGIHSEIVPFNITAEEIRQKQIKGIILSGGPYSVYQKNSPLPDKAIYELGIPILGICYGEQVIAYQLGGEVKKGVSGEFGFTYLEILDKNDPLFHNVKNKSICWMSHFDTITKIPPNFEIIARTPKTKIAGIRDKNHKIYGLQWHVEVTHTEEGYKILKNFAYNICKCKKGSWDVDEFIESTLKEIKLTIGNEKAICAVSGGVDSSTVAVLVNKILGREQLYCVHINNGVMRLNESKQVLELYKKLGLNVKYVNATHEFLRNLKGVTGSDEKRKIIGKTFIDVFEREAKKIGAKFLIQATIMPDVIESTRGEAEKLDKSKHGGIIKIHHNVGGLPERMRLKVIEPIKDLFKYQVRILARKLNLPKIISERQPQPGPAGAVRILGEITKEKIEIWQKANDLVEKIMRKVNPDQYFAVLLPNEYVDNSKIINKSREVILKFFNNEDLYIKLYIFSAPTIGIKGDERIYKYALGVQIRKKNSNIWSSLDKIQILNLQSSLTGCVDDIVRVAGLISSKINFKESYIILVRSVETKDYMTAVPTIPSKEILENLNEKLINIPKIGAVFYDYTTKPSATIEYI